MRSPSSTRAGPQLAATLHDAHDRAGEVDGIGFHHTGMLGGLPAQQRAPGEDTCGGYRFDDGPVANRVEGADGEVVDESEGSRPDRGEVVDAHGNEVVAHSVPAPGSPRQLQLRSHPVGGHHQHGLAVAGRDGDTRSEPAEAPDDVLVPGRGHRTGDRSDVAVGAFQIDPGLPVGGHVRSARAGTCLLPPGLRSGNCRRDKPCRNRRRPPRLRRAALGATDSRASRPRCAP